MRLTQKLFSEFQAILLNIQALFILIEVKK